jgi:hypothetical protein
MPEEEEARQLIARARWLVENTRTEPLEGASSPSQAEGEV